MTKTFLVANFKSNFTSKEAKSWLNQVKTNLPQISSKLEIVLCVPFIHLTLFTNFPKSKLGVQNLSPYPDGAYTGEISARMLRPLTHYALLGHSERRDYFKETSNQVALKVSQALENKIIPIIAVSRQNWHQQLNLIKSKELNQSIIMYEPPEAISRQVGPIGQGQAAPVKEVVKAIQEIKKSAPQSPVLYGGSIKNNNLEEFLSNKVINGVVVGSASLNVNQWLKILEISLSCRG